MKPAPFAYHDPRTIDEAVSLVSSLDNARLLAGGQSLVPMMNFRAAAPDHLIDLNRVAGIAGIEIRPQRTAIRAMTRQRDVQHSAALAETAPILAEALCHVGHPPTRNRGTIGGSLAHMDPTAELPTIMMLLDADLTARSRRGSRSLAMRDFARDLLTTDLAPDEILTDIAFAPWPRGHGYAFLEVARRHGDFALVSSGVLLDCDGTGAIRRAAIVLGGMGPVPQRCSTGEAMLVGNKSSGSLFADAARQVERLEAMSDSAIDAGYRRRVGVALTQRALGIARGRCRPEGSA